MELIVEDIEANPGRELQSVVVTSMNAGVGLEYDKLKNDPVTWNTYTPPIHQLVQLGVPLVCSAGNEAATRPNIDSFPAIVSDDDAPIIVVGAADYEGKKASFSQEGPQLTIYGPGISVDSQKKKDGEHDLIHGTSVGKLDPTHPRRP